MTLFSYIEGGDWTEHDRRTLREYHADGDHEQDTMAAAIAGKWHELKARSALLRDELIDDREWYGSQHVNEFRRGTDIDSCIYSGMPGGALVEFVGMTFHRGWNERPFAERERLLIEILQQGARRLFWAYARQGVVEHHELAGLPLRLRQVLVGLAQGDSEKQLAVRLSLTQGTVHSHVKRLYKRLGVSSRGELYAFLATDGRMDWVRSVLKKDEELL